MVLRDDLLDQGKDFPLQLISLVPTSSEMSACSFSNLLKNLFFSPSLPANYVIGLLRCPPCIVENMVHPLAVEQVY